MRYAVYVVVTEDTEAADMDLGSAAVSSIRLAGNLPEREAEALTRDVDSSHWLNDELYDETAEDEA